MKSNTPVSDWKENEIVLYKKGGGGLFFSNLLPRNILDDKIVEAWCWQKYCISLLLL